MRHLSVAVLCISLALVVPAPSLADGWGAASMTRVVEDGPLPGASIRWETVKENQVKKALKECGRQKKPALVYFHQDSCAACTRLWNAIMQSARIAKDAKRFVMVKVMQADVPPSKKEPNVLGTRPDGGYTPRVLFYNASGVFQPKVYNAIGTTTRRHPAWHAARNVRPCSKRHATCIVMHSAALSPDELCFVCSMIACIGQRTNWPLLRPGNANFKYFYYTEDQLLESMWQMLPVPLRTP
jgi:hypothetical protein